MTLPEHSREIERPECFWHLSEDNYRFFEITDHDETKCYFAFVIWKTVATIHVEVIKWGPATARFMRRVFKKEWMPWFRAQGVNKLASARSFPDDKVDMVWVKFLQIFGFKKPRAVFFTERKI